MTRSKKVIEDRMSARRLPPDFDLAGNALRTFSSKIRTHGAAQIAGKVPMQDPKHLEDSLNRLRSEVAALDVGDEEARLQLAQLVHDIEMTLANPQLASNDVNLGDRLKASILRFEASHPRLATVMNQITEQLGNMGI